MHTASPGGNSAAVANTEAQMVSGVPARAGHTAARQVAVRMEPEGRSESGEGRRSFKMPLSPWHGLSEHKMLSYLQGSTKKQLEVGTVVQCLRVPSGTPASHSGTSV